MQARLAVLPNCWGNATMGGGDATSAPILVRNPCPRSGGMRRIVPPSAPTTGMTGEAIGSEVPINFRK